MEENKDVTAEGGLSTESEPGAACEPGAAVGSIVPCKPSTEDNLCAEDGLRAVRGQSAERRFRMASGLRAQDGVGVAGTYAPRCDQCKQPILRLETYIAVGDVTLCDGCYMNMGTGEFLAKIGGELRVME